MMMIKKLFYYCYKSRTGRQSARPLTEVVAAEAVQMQGHSHHVTIHSSTRSGLLTVSPL